ncbi:MAG: GH3 family domain-containing protein, partial [Pseudomonadota bacterium]
MTRLLDPTKLIRPFAHRRMRALWERDPVAAQRRALARLLHRAKATRFGRAHGFDRLGDDVGAFQAAVPLGDYDDFWQGWWKDAFPVLDDLTWPGRIPFFAATSGTTSGRTKYIPLTHETLKQNRRAALDMVAAHLVHHPHSRFFGGRSFVLGGSTALQDEAPGIWSGDLSGIVAKTAPAWMRPFTFPPKGLALEADWDEKLRLMSDALPSRTITSLSGVPSWVLLLFERLEAAHDRWPLPDLEVFVHGGVPYGPYKQRVAPYLARSGAVTREVYPASEAFLAYADRGPDEGLLLAYDGAGWVGTTPTTLQNLAVLGLGTNADASNPFSAKLNAALWTA